MPRPVTGLTGLGTGRVPMSLQLIMSVQKVLFWFVRQIVSLIKR